MKQTIRKDVFETNSSSEHSIVLTKCTPQDEFTLEEIKESFFVYMGYNRKGCIVDFRKDDCLEFERYPFQLLYTYCDKLRYVLASYSYEWDDEQYEKFLQHIKKEIGVKEFIFNPGDEYTDTSNFYGYVDHQSKDVLQTFLRENSLNIDTFLKSKKYMIVIDGDEYCIYDSYKEINLVTDEPTNMGNLNDTQQKLLEQEINEDVYAILDKVFFIHTKSNTQYTDKELDKSYWTDNGWLRSDWSKIVWDETKTSEDYVYSDCLDKLIYCMNVYLFDDNRLNELRDIAITYFGIKDIKTNKRDFQLSQIQISDRLLLDNMLNDKTIGWNNQLKNFILDKSWVIVINRKNTFKQLLKNHNININNIDRIVSLRDYKK